MELCRFVPVACSVAIAVGVLAALAALVDRLGPWWAAALSGGVMLGAGLTAALLTTVAKWVVVGGIERATTPLELVRLAHEVVDTFVEMVAAPWFAARRRGPRRCPVAAQPRGRIGRGVWCESYWLPEADLVRLGDGVSVNRGASSRRICSMIV